MIYINNNTELLKDLISRFTKIVYLSEKELEIMHKLIFSSASDLTFKEDSEIYETIIYFRDVVQAGAFKNLEELVGYFDKQKQELDDLVKPLLNEKESESVDGKVLRVFYFSFKTDSIKTLTVGNLPKRLPSMHDGTRQLSESAKLLNINWLDVYKEMTISSYCWHRIKRFRNIFFKPVILPDSDDYHFKNYYEKFSPKNIFISKWIYFMKRIKNFFSVLLIDDVRKVSEFIKKKKNQREKTERYYRKIFESISTEQSTRPEELKLALSRMMILSKLNNPTFRKKRLEENKSSFKTKKEYYKYLKEKQWSVLKSPKGSSWITSDNPGISIGVDHFGKNLAQTEVDPYWSDINSNTLIYFPLSSQLCLRLQAPDISERNLSVKDGITYETSSEDEVKVVNNLIFSGKPKVVLSEDKGILINCKGGCK